jgi:cell filamentation protein
VLAHHVTCFQDVYPWAGQVRTVNITKGTTTFCSAAFIESAASDIFA